jgi:hypothetical protein
VFWLELEETKGVKEDKEEHRVFLILFITIGGMDYDTRETSGPSSAVSSASGGHSIRGRMR